MKNESDLDLTDFIRITNPTKVLEFDLNFVQCSPSHLNKQIVGFQEGHVVLSRETSTVFTL